MRTPIPINVAKVNRVIGADTYRRIAGADAIRHGLVHPGKTVISRDRYALTPGAGTARRVRHVNSAVRSYLHGTVNAAVTFRGIKNVDARTESDTAIIAARTLGSARDVL